MRVVLTGACCGKSTLLTEFRKRGYPTLDEVARRVLDNARSQGFTDYRAIQEQILIHQLEEENCLSDNLSFLDRGAVDVLAYSRKYLSSLPNIFYQTDFKNRYDFVFLLDRFPLEKDGTRVESDDSEAEEIHKLIYSCYTENGYSPISVPIFSGNLEDSVSKRADFVLEFLKSTKDFYT